MVEEKFEIYDVYVIRKCYWNFLIMPSGKTLRQMHIVTRNTNLPPHTANIGSKKQCRPSDFSKVLLYQGLF